ncbi:TrkA family potassium uptake protein, partial [bacterium]|nr:TrkA family potassium uptake protein [candidate division CSSED10-310 bacterium]
MQYAVIGLGAFGRSVAIALAQERCQVMAIDVREDKVNSIAPYVARAVQLDASDENALREVGITLFRTVVVGIGSDLEASIMATLNLKELGVERVFSKAMSTYHGKILERVGADRIIYPEQDMGRRLAQSLARPTIFDHIKLSKEYSIEEVKPPPRYEGKSLRELEIRPRFGVSVIGIRHDKAGIQKGSMSRELTIAPMADDQLMPGD